MRSSKCWPIAVMTFATFFVLINDLPAANFCNMDESGGREGKKAQEKSARAAAMFFQAASTAFEMLSEIELHFAGEKDALKRASALSKKSREHLHSAFTKLEDVYTETKALEAIDATLRQLTAEGYATASRQATVPPTIPLAMSIIKAFQEKGSRGALQICGQSIKELQSTEKPMGQVYSVVGNALVPSADVFWSAIAQWNETLIKGRLISSIFKTKGP